MSFSNHHFDDGDDESISEIASEVGDMELLDIPSPPHHQTSIKEPFHAPRGIDCLMNAASQRSDDEKMIPFTSAALQPFAPNSNNPGHAVDRQPTIAGDDKRTIINVMANKVDLRGFSASHLGSKEHESRSQAEQGTGEKVIRDLKQPSHCEDEESSQQNSSGRWADLTIGMAYATSILWNKFTTRIMGVVIVLVGALLLLHVFTDNVIPLIPGAHWISNAVVVSKALASAAMAKVPSLTSFNAAPPSIDQNVDSQSQLTMDRALAVMDSGLLRKGLVVGHEMIDRANVTHIFNNDLIEACDNAVTEAEKVKRFDREFFTSVEIRVNKAYQDLFGLQTQAKAEINPTQEPSSWLSLLFTHDSPKNRVVRMMDVLENIIRAMKFSCEEELKELEQACGPECRGGGQTCEASNLADRKKGLSEPFDDVAAQLRVMCMSMLYSGRSWNRLYVAMNKHIHTLDALLDRGIPTTRDKPVEEIAKQIDGVTATLMKTLEELLRWDASGKE